MPVARGHRTIPTVGLQLIIHVVMAADRGHIWRAAFFHTCYSTNSFYPSLYHIRVCRYEWATLTRAEVQLRQPKMLIACLKQLNYNFMLLID